jgi:hypothetical protein
MNDDLGKSEFEVEEIVSGRRRGEEERLYEGLTRRAKETDLCIAVCPFGRFRSKMRYRLSQ